MAITCPWRRPEEKYSIENSHEINAYQWSSTWRSLKCFPWSCSIYRKLKSANNHLYSHNFILPSKSNPGGFFSLIVMPDMGVSAASPCCWRFSTWWRIHRTQQLCSFEKHCPGTSPFPPSGLTSEHSPCPWFWGPSCVTGMLYPASCCLDSGRLGYLYLPCIYPGWPGWMWWTQVPQSPLSLSQPHTGPQWPVASATPGMSALVHFAWQNSLPLLLPGTSVENCQREYLV